jgi:hypothetical protein
LSLQAILSTLNPEGRGRHRSATLRGHGRGAACESPRRAIHPEIRQCRIEGLRPGLSSCQHRDAPLRPCSSSCQARRAL